MITESRTAVASGASVGVDIVATTEPFDSDIEDDGTRSPPRARLDHRRAEQSAPTGENLEASYHSAIESLRASQTALTEAQTSAHQEPWIISAAMLRVDADQRAVDGHPYTLATRTTAMMAVAPTMMPAAPTMMPAAPTMMAAAPAAAPTMMPAAPAMMAAAPAMMAAAPAALPPPEVTQPLGYSELPIGLTQPNPRKRQGPEIGLLNNKRQDVEFDEGGLNRYNPRRQTSRRRNKKYKKKCKTFKKKHKT